MTKLKGKISKDMRRIAESNGISLPLLRYRIAKDWDPLQAITEPPREQAPAGKSDKDMLALAKQNGISSSAFRTRVKVMKMDEYEAATMPLMNPHERAKRSSEAREGIPLWQVEEAAKNGISYITLYRRLRVYKPVWDVQRAITEPPAKNNTNERRRVHDVAESLGIDWRAIRAKQHHGRQEHDPVILTIAEANGISYETYIYRTVTSPHPLQPLEAATKPLRRKKVKIHG